MMRRWTTGPMLFAAFAGGGVCASPLGAATLNNVKFDLKRGTVKAAPHDSHGFGLRMIFERDDWEPVFPDEARFNRSVMASTAATSRAIAISTPRGAPISLEIEALAGHRSFNTMRTRRSILGWSWTPSGNVLGVGMTGTYGVQIAKAWRFTPFVSLDYNRIDSARYVDATSPNPYVTDNADTGLTGTVGAVVSHRFGTENRFRALAFGSVVAATSTGGRPREFGSFGTRFVRAIGDSAIKATWEEVGLGLDYRLTPRALLNGAVIHTLGRQDGETMAAKLGLRIVL